MSARTASASAPPVKPLAYVGGFFAYGLGLSALYATTGLGVACPFRLVTGWDCPLCGATRMGSALLHADLAAAWAFNPVVLVGLVLLGALGGVWAFEAMAGRRLPRPRVLGLLANVQPTSWLVLGLSVALVFTVLRNLA